MHRSVKDLTGQKFGRLTALRVLKHRTSTGGVIWACLCSCGNKCQVASNGLLRGTKSCGCFAREQTKIRNSSHGHTAGLKQSRTYASWIHAKARCNDAEVPSYRYAGAIGIKFCKRWAKFETFLADMGKCPPGRSLDRINPWGNYSPSNCRWATPTTQNRNKRKLSHSATFNGHLVGKKGHPKNFKVRLAVYTANIKYDIRDEIAARYTHILIPLGKDFTDLNHLVGKHGGMRVAPTAGRLKLR